MSQNKAVDFSTLLRKTLSSIVVNRECNEIIFTVGLDEEVYRMYHYQYCCEDVRIEDIVGDVEDLIGHPLLVAECVSKCDTPPSEIYSETWTFYKLTTIKGSVTLRWYGTSHGYSEEVNFVLMGRGN
jgi:hypothetical protein